MMTYSLTWDLESIFAGGSQSDELKTRMDQLDQENKLFQTQVAQWEAETDAPLFSAFVELFGQAETIQKGLAQCFSFVVGIQSANVNDKYAKTVLGKLYEISTDYHNVLNPMMKKVATISEKNWAALKETPLAQKHGVWFNLEEWRRKGKELLSDQEEAMINHLSIDGFVAWSNHYDTIVASINIPFIDEKGEEIQLSAGQAFNKMMSDPDPAVRSKLFEVWEKTWAEKAPLFADTLNHLDGFRLTNYQLHDVDHFLTPALQYNRMKKETLDMMWATIQKNKQPFVDFLTRKAQLFGKDKMEWQDQDAPIILGNLEEKRFTFDQAADFITTNFQKFSPKMASFAKQAFEKSWIEAEDRPGKRPGGYCTGLPESQESRIFMTYGESINEVSTLAHELGHAFHSHVMWDLPSVSQDYAMNVAETASTFAELIVADATVREASTPEEKINLLDIKMQNAIAMFMNIHARFLFETNFYETRQQKVLSDEEITQLMVDAQKEAYAGALATYHPHFWASKLHFYIDDVPFYNFPYTFGYLFSMGIYAYAQQAEGQFEDHYIALLRDTASMTTEELAQKHLGVDLTQPDFWQAAIDVIVKDIDEFMALSKDFV